MFLRITSTLGTACVMGFVVLLLFRNRRLRQLAAQKDLTYQIAMAVIFGLLAIYGTASSVEVEGAKATARDAAPLIAGLLGGPIAGLGAGLLGALQRWFVGGATALPCGLACLTSGALGWGLWELEKQRHRPLSLALVALASAVETGLHMLWVTIFGQAAAVAPSVLPILISAAVAAVLMLFSYRTLNSLN